MRAVAPCTHCTAEVSGGLQEEAAPLWEWGWCLILFSSTISKPPVMDDDET